MTRRLILFGLILAGLLFGLYAGGGAICALSARKLELTFVVTDAETGEPIPNASIDLMVDNYEQGPEQLLFKLITDREGRTRYVSGQQFF